MPISIYTFGSNLPGRHGKGTALIALRQHGAVYGVGEGLQGKSYAIPTRNADPIGSKYPNVRSLPLKTIKIHVERFLDFSNDNQQFVFNLMEIGCTNAGYQPQEIAIMFRNSPKNVILPDRFKIFT